MRLATLRLDDTEKACFALSDRYVPVCDVASVERQPWPADLMRLLETGAWHSLVEWYSRRGAAVLAGNGLRCIPREKARLAPLYRRPRKIWGIGLNYREHAADLDEVSPTGEPASFMKPDTTLIGPGDEILLPALSSKVTGEAELGLVFGRQCRDLNGRDWREVLAGFTTIIDMTAEDILRRNPRNLTQSKSFDTFFSLGHELVTPDEIGDIRAVRVSTIHNGAVHAENVVANMTFPPEHLVSYHSRIMTMLPGDIISTGTPGAAHLAGGDTIECVVEGIGRHSNPVRDLKKA